MQPPHTRDGGWSFAVDGWRFAVSVSFAVCSYDRDPKGAGPAVLRRAVRAREVLGAGRRAPGLGRAAAPRARPARVSERARRAGPRLPQGAVPVAARRLRAERDLRPECGAAPSPQDP